MDENIALWIKEIRKSNKYSQEDFGKKILGISKRQVIRLENMEAELSLLQFLQIITYFDLDKHTTINELLDVTNNMEKLKTLYGLAKDPTYNGDELLLQVEELISNENISDYNLSRLELMRSFINFKETKDGIYLEYFVNHIDSESIDDIRLLNCSLYLLSNRQIVESLNALKKNDFNKKAEILNKLLINALGTLVSRNYEDYDYIEKLFVKAKDYTLKNREYIYLPILFYHMAIFNKNISDEVGYSKYKEKALFLAEIYENKDLAITIMNEI